MLFGKPTLLPDHTNEILDIKRKAEKYMVRLKSKRNIAWAKRT
jgi:hypothetical protein